MIAKKNPKLQEEKNRVVYFQLGLLVTGTSLLMAFTWKTPVNSSEKLIVERSSDIEVIQMLEEEKEKPIEIPEVKKVQEKETDPITVKTLTSFTDPTVNKDIDEKIFVEMKVEDGDKIGSGEFDLDIGERPELKDGLVDFPDKEASFEGNWYQYLRENTVYPEIAQEWGEEGSVYVSFIVERNGSITDVQVKNKKYVAESLQKEAIRVVKSSPRWKPGVKGGEYVRSVKTVKVNFILARE